MKTASETPIPTVNSDDPSPPEASPSTNEPAHPLMAEVESFLSRRDELAKKLAEEIEATEKKLAELRKIAESLFPENAAQGPVDRKAKKHKAKTSHRESKPDSTGSSEATNSAE